MSGARTLRNPGHVCDESRRIYASIRSRSTHYRFSFYYSAIAEISLRVLERDRLLSSSARSHWSIGRKMLHESPPRAPRFSL